MTLIQRLHYHKLIIIDIVLVLLIAVIVAATKPPDKVQGLEVKNTSYNSVSLSWEKTENTSRYSIMRAEDGKTYECIDTTKDTSFVDNHLETGKTYTYKVESNNGIKKTESTKKVNATPALDVPKIKSDISEGKAEISITNVEGAEGYKVYRDNKEIDFHLAFLKLYSFGQKSLMVLCTFLTNF